MRNNDRRLYARSGNYPDPVLLDGVEINSVTIGAADLSNLTSENTDRIEVLRGGGGTLYGSQAVGGVMNVLSKRGKDH